MDFKDLDLTHCLNKQCGQKFTSDNIKLAVWLYGVVFLSEEVVSMENKTPGAYIGITCPRCLSTILWPCSKQGLFSFKAELDSELQIMKLEQSDTGNTIVEPVYSFEPHLRYYSPFNLNKEVLGQRMVFSRGFPAPESSPNFYNHFQEYTATEIFDQEKLFCSYLIEDTPPMGNFSNVLWFNEEDISELLAIENEKHVRIFPRYIYRTELVTKIDHLLAYHYVNGKQLDLAIADHKTEMAYAREKLRAYARENNLNFENLAESNGLMEPDVFINQAQETLERMNLDPLIPAQFLDILTAEPSHLGEAWYQGHCDYFWASVDPFVKKDLPDFFVDQIDIHQGNGKIAELRERHQKMATRVQNNQTKQYTQESLRTNIVDFLEQYEELIQGNEFSYAHVWQLKESYLQGLYKDVNKGCREEVSYAMYREGTGWKIVFNGKSFGGLRGKGFLWIYLTIFHKSSPVYYTSLHDTFGAKSSNANKNQVAGSKDERTVPKRKGHTDFEQESYREKAMDDMKNTGQVSFTYSGVLTKQFYVDVATLEKCQEELDQKELAIEKAKQSDDIETFEEALDDMTEFLEDLEKKYGIRKIKNVDPKPGEKDYKLVSQMFKDERYKQIGENIKKNYRDALNLLKKTKDAKDLHAHLLNSIRKEGGAFIYEPSEDIAWHLD